MENHRHDFVVLHPSRPEFVALAEADAFVLPGVDGETWMLTHKLLDALRSELSLDAVMLQPVRTWRSGSEGDSTLYLLLARTDLLPTRARWIDLSALKTGVLTYPGLDVLETLLLEDAEPERVPALRSAWANRSWLAEVQEWLSHELTRIGRLPTGDLTQVKQWSLSAVLRQPTDKGDVYFKAAMDHFIAEPRITAAVSAHFPDLTPTVLAIEPGRGWLVLDAFQDEELDESQLLEQCDVLRRFSAMQRASIPDKGVFLEAGCTDRGLSKLREAVPQLFRESLELDRLKPEERENLLAMEAHVLDQISTLEAHGLPETLVHGDLHFGNIAVDGQKVTIFDWTDACWSHPFFDITLQYFREQAAEARAALVEAYLEPWLARYEETQVRESLALAVRLGPLFYAQSYEGIKRAQEPDSRSNLSGVVASFLKQLVRSDESNPVL